MVVSSDASRPRYDHDIPARAEAGGIEPVDLSEAAADSVAHAGMAELCRHRVPHTAARPAVFAAIDDQIRSDGALSLAVQTAKITVFFQSTSDIQGTDLHKIALPKLPKTPKGRISPPC